MPDMSLQPKHCFSMYNINTTASLHNVICKVSLQRIALTLYKSTFKNKQLFSITVFTNTNAIQSSTEVVMQATIESVIGQQKPDRKWLHHLMQPS